MATVFSTFSSSRFRVCPELDWHKKHQGSFHSNHELTTIKKMVCVHVADTVARIVLYSSSGTIFMTQNKPPNHEEYCL